MTISRQDVEHIALLARLYLTEEELDRYSNQLGSILQYIEKINSLDTSAVPPTSHPIQMVNVFRPDAVEPSLAVDEALANAPDKQRPYFRVPRVVD